jgi:hypothetical protein
VADATVRFVDSIKRNPTSRHKFGNVGRVSGLTPHAAVSRRAFAQELGEPRLVLDFLIQNGQRFAAGAEPEACLREIQARLRTFK